MPEVAASGASAPAICVGGVGVVAGRDGRVGGEDGALARGGDRVLGADAALGGRGARQLEAGQRGVALVEVHDARARCPARERADAADAEQRVLPQPHLGVADVEARGDPAVGDAVLRAVGVEQQQRHAADVDAPHLGDDVAAGDRDGDRERLAVLAGDERGRHAVGIGVDPVLVLPAGAVDALAEVAVAVHQADRDERQRAVGGLLEDVAGEHAEAAGVDRQRAVDGVLRAEEGDGRSGDTPAGVIALRAPVLATALEAHASAPGSARPRQLRAAGRDGPPAAAGPGCRATGPSASGRSTRTAPGRPGSRTSGSCRRSPRAGRAARAAASAERPLPRGGRRSLRRAEGARQSNESGRLRAYVHRNMGGTRWP